LILGGALLFACTPISGWLASQSSEEPPATFDIITATTQPTKVLATATLAPIPSPVGTPTNSSAAPEEDLSLNSVFSSEEIPSGILTDLWVDGDGELWLSGSQGVLRREDGEWLALYDQPADLILGEDAIGRVWVVLDDGAAIGAWRDGDWTVYGPERGWQPPERGGYLSRGFGDGLVMDEQGRLWLATGRDDLRRLNPENGQWQRLSARMIGFAPPDEEGYQGHFLTDVALSGSDKVWVSNCIGVGEGLDGQGIQRYSGEEWLSTAFTADDCIFDLEEGARGVMWAGAIDDLLRYSPITGSWSRIRLPIWGRFQVVLDVTLDEQGRPWVELLRAGGASLDGGAAHFYLNGDEWVPVIEQGASWEPYSLVQAGEGKAWIYLKGVLYFADGKGLQEIGSLPVWYMDLAVDGKGRLWLANVRAPASEVWYFDPPVEED